MGRSRRRKNAPRPRPTEIDAVPDEVLELVFLRLPSPAHLVRAACICRRWRRVIAGDGGRFLRRFGSLHGVSTRIVGHYRVEQRYQHPCPPGGSPVFVPSPSSPWADTVAALNLPLDFLPQLEYGGGRWELADIRGGPLFLVQLHGPSDMWPPTGIAVCDPLTRRYRDIPLSAWFRGFCLMGAFLLDGDGDNAGARISLSNFRVTCAIYRSQCGTVRACAFSSAGRGRWTSGGSAAVYRARGHQFAAPIHFAGIGPGSAHWTIGDNILLRLDKDAAELSSFVLPNSDLYAKLRSKRQALEYPYRLPWPPTMESCLS